MTRSASVGQTTDLHDHERRPAGEPDVIKLVVNDNGGTAAATDFTMTINGVSARGGTRSRAPRHRASEDAHLGRLVQRHRELCCRGTRRRALLRTAPARSRSARLGPARSQTTTRPRSSRWSRPSSTITAAPRCRPRATWLRSGSPASPVRAQRSRAARLRRGHLQPVRVGGPAGYDASAWDCTGESQADNDAISVGLGDGSHLHDHERRRAGDPDRQESRRQRQRRHEGRATSRSR